MKNEKLYINVGKTLELIQLWETEFKVFTQKAHIEKSDDKRSLSNMNSFLLRNNIINEKEFLLIKKIIEIRNYIIHRLFLTINDLDISETECYLENAKVAINESINMFKKSNIKGK